MAGPVGPISRIHGTYEFPRFRKLGERVFDGFIHHAA
jgi:hypothetical protein